MTREILQKYLPSSVMVAEKEKDLPVWPILKQGGASPVVAYVFESKDIAPMPGISGAPMNMLITLGVNGDLLDVSVLSQHEPLFIKSLGDDPLDHFVDQYQGMSLRRNIKVSANRGLSDSGYPDAYIDGVTKATATARILNHNILNAALKVANSKLGMTDLQSPAASEGIHLTSWWPSWQQHAWDLAVLCVMLGVLTVALSKQAWVAGNLTYLNYFRSAYLLFTLLVIGYYWQAQLSVVNIMAVLQAVIAGHGLGFLLYAPMLVVLWVYVIISFFIWGRGTFCGWLCPFGALQELASKFGAMLGIKPIRVATQLDARLKKVKYVFLVGILAATCFMPDWAEYLVEIEPFKTSITLMFIRSLPFVVWAVALVILSAYFYKGYCRYLCPLGAGMAILGRLRLWDWVPRRQECGQPCQRCSHDCSYQAIQKTGKIDYVECFQCFDCVAIYQSDNLCVPRIMEIKKSKQGVVIPILPARLEKAKSKSSLSPLTGKFK